MMQEPGATIRIDGQLYRELRAIADARDCTLRQAMDFWIDRERAHGRENTKRADGGGGKGNRKPGKRSHKAKAKPGIVEQAIDSFDQWCKG